MRNLIKVILFDMDGVLIDAKEWHYEALNKALDLFGMKISRFDHLNTYDGLPTKKKLEMLSQERGLPFGLHQFINDIKQKFTVIEIMNKCMPLFEHEYALSMFKRDGYRMAVCSNSVRHSIELMMYHAKLDGYLDFYLSNEDVTKGKPDPEMYNKAIQKMGVQPNEVVIIEDNINGIKAAKASGSHVLEVESVKDVTYHNIKKFIHKIEENTAENSITKKIEKFGA